MIPTEPTIQPGERYWLRRGILFILGSINGDEYIRYVDGDGVPYSSPADDIDQFLDNAFAGTNTPDPEPEPPVVVNPQTPSTPIPAAPIVVVPDPVSRSPNTVSANGVEPSFYWRIGGDKPAGPIIPATHEVPYSLQIKRYAEQLRIAA